jgi:hypothetical protein
MDEFFEDTGLSPSESHEFLTTAFLLWRCATALEDIAVSARDATVDDEKEEWRKDDDDTD